MKQTKTKLMVPKTDEQKIAERFKQTSYLKTLAQKRNKTPISIASPRG